jgi:hypothetical protein
MSAATRTAQILMAVDKSRSTKVSKVTAAERTALLLATADTKVKVTQTFKDMYEAHQQSTESPKKKSKITVVETPTESMDCKSPSKNPSKSKSKITVVETPTESKVETPKKRGRPAGSKDKAKRKTKSSVEKPTESAAERTAKLLKNADSKVETPKKQKSKTKSSVEKPTESAAERTAKLLKKVETPKKQSKTKSAVKEVPKKRGCPKGSHKKCGICGGVGHNKRTCPI